MFVLLLFSVSWANESTYPLNVLEDVASFTFYLNEEVLVRGSFEWRKDGNLKSDYTLTMAGQSVSTSMKIAVDDNGIWNTIDMETPRGLVQIVREGDVVRITSNGTSRQRS
jgi:hypothetical protein